MAQPDPSPGKTGGGKNLTVTPGECQGFVF